MGYPQQGQPPQHPQQGYQQQQPYPQQHGGHAPVPAQHHAQPAGGGYNMKKRNIIGVWLGLPIITLGIYSIVWFFKIHKELAQYDRRIPDQSTGALLAVLFGWITLYIWPLIVWIKLADHIRQAQRAAGLQPSCSTGLGIVLGILGFGSLYYQMELNKVVDRYGDTPPMQQVPLYA
ncbi:DUF4234 domain-containing protein [Thermomonospora umbrina]|uniref:Uncharacterized protein DUF4234 n=1 Tax=Thermomonospora umbrina TaxID=111806 RepID=A0A3D9SGY3_9ACTN|nr:DUF4234 domain-containing protein [Thermomonospora umbrina]REE95169.1 uncharacterized protein DUF4234 [Thermomonospora umbrina]